MDQELAPHGCVRPISANQTRTTSTCASILPRATPCGASQGNRWFHDQLPASVNLKPLRPVFPPVRRVGSDLGCPVAGRPGRRTQRDDAGTPGLGRFPPIRVNVTDAPRPRTPRAVEGPSSGPPPASLGRAAGWRSAFRRRAHPSSPARPLHAPEWCRCASWGRVLPLRRRCKEQTTRGIDNPRTPDLAHSEHANISVRNPHPQANTAWRAERTPDGRRVPRERRARVGVHAEVDSLALVRTHRAPFRHRRPRLGVGAPSASASDLARRATTPLARNEGHRRRELGCFLPRERIFSG
jgi:hypothetical protein